LRLKTVGSDEERIDDESGRPSHDDDARSTVVLRRLSPGDYQDSASREESVNNRLENYRDEVERIRDAIADSDWYDDEEPTNEDEDDRPIGACDGYLLRFVHTRCVAVRCCASRCIQCQ